MTTENPGEVDLADLSSRMLGMMLQGVCTEIGVVASNFADVAASAEPPGDLRSILDDLPDLLAVAELLNAAIATARAREDAAAKRAA